MKKLLCLFAFFTVVGLVSVDAQDCHGKHKTATVEKTATTKTAAAKAAALDENIEEKVCAYSGKVSYVRKSVCPASGKVSYADVDYDAASGKFVNQSPSETMKKGASCSGKASAAKVSGKSGKGCCAGKKTAKACCAKGASSGCAGKASTKVTPSSSKVKLIKGDES